jgi:hypothetical protein
MSMSAQMIDVRDPAELPPLPASTAPPISYGADPLGEADRLGPARAVANGLLISVPFWMLFGLAVWMWWF